MTIVAAPQQVDDPQQYVQEHISSTLTPALAALCRERPADPVTWLANYLLANKPPPPVVKQRPTDRLISILLAECKHVEPKLTGLITDLAAQFPGSRLLDMDCRLKSEMSIALKVARFAGNVLRKNPDLTREQGEEDLLRLHTTHMGRPPDPIVVDAIRYTLVVPTPLYAAAVRAVREEMMSTHGFEQIDNKNFWYGVQTYRGINDIYAMPIGEDTAWGCATGAARELFFELQLHTPESIALKHDLHPMMKRVQDPSTDSATKERLKEEMIARVHACAIPEGALELPKEVVRPPWW